MIGALLFAETAAAGCWLAAQLLTTVGGWMLRAALTLERRAAYCSPVEAWTR